MCNLLQYKYGGGGKGKDPVNLKGKAAMAWEKR